MASIRAFDGHFVHSDIAHVVASPPYDALTPEERHEFARANPRNYLNVMRSLEEFPADERPTHDELLDVNSQKLREFFDQGVYNYKEEPCLFLYRLSIDGHVQTGVVAEVPIEEYDLGLIKKHEHTQQDKEDQLTAYQEVVGASSSPVCLAYPRSEAINSMISRLTREEPLLEFTALDGLTQTIWCVEKASDIAQFAELFATVPVTYLTDGHHRCAAGSRYAAKMRETNPDHTGDEPYNFILVALFPDDELRILPYNRCVRDLNGLSVPGFLERLREIFDVRALEGDDPEAAAPRSRGELSMLLDGVWYRLRAQNGLLANVDPVRSLDVMLLQEHVLRPLLGIEDPRSDPRLLYVAGTFHMRGLVERCAQGWRVAFAVYPTSIEQLMAVADADQVMPPKSTWFDPKARSGLFLKMR